MKRANRLLRAQGITNQFGLIVIIAALGIIFTFLDPVFISGDNILNIVRQASANIIVAVGLTFVAISGNLDLSIGGVACLTGMLSAVMMTSGFSTWTACAISCVIGILVGLCNGVLVTRFNLSSMIVTLATSNICNGISNLLTGGTAIYDLPSEFELLGRGYIGFLPVQVVIMIVIVVISAIVLAKTLFGRYAFAVGGNATVAKLAGLHVNFYKTAYFILCGLCASIVGLILTSRLGSGQPGLAANMQMDTMTSVVIGGTMLHGGSGTVIGSLLGALMLTVISNGLTINGVNSFWQNIISAVILLATIIFRREKH